MRQGYIDPVVSKEKTISTGPPGGGGASTLDFLDGEGSASFASSFLLGAFGVASSLSLPLDGADRLAPLPPPLPLAAAGAFAGADSVMGASVGVCGVDVQKFCYREYTL